MKLALLLPIALLMGCAGKPKYTSASFYNDIHDNTFIALQCPDGAAVDVISEQFGCVQVGTYHATPAQWAAAQGLYNSEVFCSGGATAWVKFGPHDWRQYDRFYVDQLERSTHELTMMCSTFPPVFATLPLSGDAK